MAEQQGAAVTASGTHGLSCLKSRGRFPRHENLKEIIGRALRSAVLPTRLEPLVLCRGTDNRRPDGETLVPWQSGQPLAFDVTCIVCNIVCPVPHWSRRKPKKERSTPISGATFLSGCGGDAGPVGHAVVRFFERAGPATQ